MAAFTLLCRLTDGLPLCQSADPLLLPTAAAADTVSKQAKAIVAGLGPRSEARATVEAAAHSFHYVVAADDNLVLLVCIVDKAYPKRLAFGLLADLRTAFLEEVAHPAPAAAAAAAAAASAAAAPAAPAPASLSVSTADKPYAFMRFERMLTRLRKEYADPASKTNAARLKEELADIQSIMRKNIEEVLNRGDKLEHVSRISSKLVSESKKFRFGAKKLNLLDMYKRMAPYAVAGVLLICVVYYKFFL